MTTPVSDFVGMKNWDDKKQCWIGVVCRVMKNNVGKEFIEVADVVDAKTQVEIDDLIAESIATKPWERHLQDANKERE